MSILLERAVSPGAQPPMPKKPPMSWSKRGLIVVMLGVLGLGIWSTVELRINIATFIDGWDNAVNFLSRTVPLKFPEPIRLVEMIGQTIAIVVLATVLGLVLSLPIAFLAAKNTTVNSTVRAVARSLIVLERAVPDFIIAIFFVRVFGLGALPGILALGIGSIGFMAKLFADAIEEVDPGPREALRAAGASTFQQIVGGVLPGLRPTLVATTLHAFDINLRGSVILGFVGVAGIGMYISAALDTMNYRLGLGLTLVLLILCLVAELVSGLVRKAQLGHESASSSKSRRWLTVLLPHLPEKGWAKGKSTPAERRAAAVGRTSPPWNRQRINRTGWSVFTALLVLGSAMASGVSLSQLAGGFAKALETIGLYFPPSDGDIPEKLILSMLETVQMGLAGTVIGLIVAIPFGLLSARTIAPNDTVAAMFRGIVVTIRAVPGIIVGIFFVVITGLGATAGALALAVGAIGFFSKVIADSLEEVDVRVAHAIRSSGASSTQTFFAATLRQVAPALSAHTLHQLDSNLRAATGLGIIGAGGIGFYMMNASRVLEYGVVTSCLILVVITVLLSEALAVWARREVQ